jgi:hypothetical protein
LGSKEIVQGGHAILKKHLSSVPQLHITSLLFYRKKRAIAQMLDFDKFGFV